MPASSIIFRNSDGEAIGELVIGAVINGYKIYNLRFADDISHHIPVRDTRLIEGCTLLEDENEVNNICSLWRIK